MPEPDCVHHLFETQARRTPGATALVEGERRVTYAQLDGEANRLAHLLRGRVGVEVEEPVGVMLPRGIPMVVTLFGIMKAGAAFVPLEPAYPPARTRATVAAAGIRRVVTAGALAGRLEQLDGAIGTLVLDELTGALAAEPATAPRVALCGDNLAYVMHTSGSTGVPKGVLVPHAGLVNYLRWCCEAYGAASGGGSAVQSPISTSMIFPSLFGPLCVGGAVTLLREDAGLDSLVEALERPGAAPFSFLKVTPSQLRLIAPRLQGTGLDGRVHTLVVGAEPLDAATVEPWRRLAPQVRIVNEYGPTETVVGRVVHELPPATGQATPATGEATPATGEAAPGTGAGGHFPIGRPIASTRIHLVGADLEAVGDGEVGELCIAGAGIARGYAGNPALTAERFVPEPRAPEPGGRMYRTGDLGRRLPSGVLECLGRSDDQLKIRGYRIEPGEVSAALRAHPAVRDAHVTARRRASDGEQALVAYVVPAGEGAGPAALRAFLAGRLPEYMLPSAFVPLERIPLGPAGKVDRAALPAPPGARPELASPYVAPAGEDEAALARAWSELLGIDEVGAGDDFFDLGGDSLLAARLLQVIGTRFDVDLTFADVMEEFTVAHLARRLAERRTERRPATPPLRRYRRTGAAATEGSQP